MQMMLETALIMCRMARRYLHTFVALLIIILGYLGLPVTAQANSVAGQWVGDQTVARARLVSAVKATGTLSTLPLGLEFQMAPGWKIYWRTPGEAGLPPSIKLALADGTALRSDISWPVPKRFDAFGFDNYGYADKVILPLRLAGHLPGTALQIRGHVDALVCADICVPLSDSIGLDIADGVAAPSQHAQDIAQFAAKVPRVGGVSSIPAPELVQGENQLLAYFPPESPVIDEIFVEGAEGVAFKKPRYADGVATIDMVDAPPTLVGTKLTLTLVAGDDFRSVTVTVLGREQLTIDRANADDPLWVFLGLAFLGGLILNLMPCVLPVLAIKLASIIEASGLAARHVRLRFVAGAAGILSSFMLLGGGVALARLAGGQIGWGIQFQSPVFLALMILVVGLFMLMMLDRLILPVPAFLQRRAPQGDVPATLSGDFIAGMLATLLATPCSAPFVGSAVTAALTGDMVLHFSIFLTMGVGLATPWILVAMFPGLVAHLPKPGNWMVWLKRGLAALLLATILWIAVLLFTIQGLTAGLITVSLLALMIFGVAGRRYILGGVAGVTLGGVLLLMPLKQPIQEEIIADSSLWKPWSESAVKTALLQNKLVFVDVTADWCITCKANKALVLDRDPVATVLRELLDGNKLTLLRADWTRPDDHIAAFLADHNRFGIPFNIIYGTQAQEGIVLGELLSADMVLDGLHRAGMTKQ